MVFNNILAAYDGSEQANKALDKAIAIAKQHADTKLHVVHVFELPQYVIGESLISAPAHIETTHYNEAQKLIDALNERLADVPHASTELLQGYAAKSVLDCADARNSDLIIIGSRGLGGFRELILGSVSSSVVQHAKIPVLVVK